MCMWCVGGGGWGWGGRKEREGDAALLLLLLLLLLVKRSMHGLYTQTRPPSTCKVHITLEIPLLV